MAMCLTTPGQSPSGAFSSRPWHHRIGLVWVVEIKCFVALTESLLGSHYSKRVYICGYPLVNPNSHWNSYFVCTSKWIWPPSLVSFRSTCGKFVWWSRFNRSRVNDVTNISMLHCLANVSKLICFNGFISAVILILAGCFTTCDRLNIISYNHRHLVYYLINLNVRSLALITLAHRG